MILIKTLVFFAASIIGVLSFAAGDTDRTQPLLWSSAQKTHVELALSLCDTPQLKEVRRELIQLYEQTPSAQRADGRETLESAVDELMFGMILSTITPDPAHPPLVWNEALPYSVDGFAVPGSRYAGDMPDRLYRNVAVDAAYSYEIRGTIDKETTLDFSIEALPGPGNWGLPPLAILQLKDMEVTEDGAFVISLDASPANGRANHLQLPPGTVSLLIRDTILDWGKHKPVALEIRGMSDNAPVSSTTMINRATNQLRQAGKVSRAFYEGIWKREPNRLDPYVRDLGWGIVAINRFQLADDEALVVTLDPLSAGYLGLQADDLWLRSADYVSHTSTLNNAQATPNADGTYTFVVAAQDPGYYNWIDTVGMNDGYLIGRWELLSQTTTGEGAVREVRKVKLGELETALPADAARVTPEERRAQLAAREAAYLLRLGKR